MKPSLLAVVPVVLALGACGHVDHYVFHDAFAEAHGRGVNARQYALDTKACGGPGPGAEWCRIAADDGNLDRMYPVDVNPQPKGVAYAYDATQCDGAFDHALCRGVSKPQAVPPPTCHGETIDGTCAGPVY